MNQNNGSKQKLRLHYGIIVLVLIVCAVFSALGLARFGYTSILPAMQQHVNYSRILSCRAIKRYGVSSAVGVSVGQTIILPPVGQKRCRSSPSWFLTGT